MDTHIPPLDRAIAHLGSQRALADALHIRSPSISEWRAKLQEGNPKAVPADRCLPIERATGGAVTRYRGVPPYAETLAYVEKVHALHERYRSAMGLKPLDPPLRPAQ